MHDGGGAVGLTQTQVLATAAGAAVLLYAGMLISLSVQAYGTCQQHELIVLWQMVIHLCVSGASNHVALLIGISEIAEA